MAETLNITQFSALNLLADSAKMQAGEFPYASNVRMRYNRVDPVQTPRHETDAPSGNYVGIFGVGDDLLVFVDDGASTGAWVQTPADSGPWAKLPNFSMATGIDEVYVEAVPASTNNFGRKLVNVVNGDVTLEDSINKSKRVIIVQDGQSQPKLIFPDFSVRDAYTYSEWTTEDREYVPIGTIMRYIDGIFIVVSPNKDEIYRSVTGRPLDFIVAVDSNGDKISASESEGGAKATSHKVKFDAITTIEKLPATDASRNLFFVGSHDAGTFILLDYENTIYAEPTFINVDMFPVGPVNSRSFVSFNGDTAYISRRGIRSFNAMRQTSEEGANVMLSGPVQQLFERILQEDTAVIEYDDYILFALDTIHGSLILVFDSLRLVFSSIDQFSVAAKIKGFTKTKDNNGIHLWAYDSSNRLFKMYSGGSFEPRIYLGDFASGSSLAHRLTNSTLIFDNSDIAGYTGVDLVVDGVVKHSMEAPLAKAWLYREGLPFGVHTTARSQEVNIAFTNTRHGWKSGIMVYWNTCASLVAAEVKYELVQGQPVNLIRATPPEELVFAVTADGGVLDDGLQSVVALIDSWNVDFVVNVGDTLYQPNTFSQIVSSGPWAKYLREGRYIDALGNHELDESGGLDYLQGRVRPNNGRYYFVDKLSLLRLLIINSGKNTAGTIVEPDGIDENSTQALRIYDWAAASTQRWNFAFFHHPPYTSSSAYSGTTELRWPFKNKGIDITFSGHAHQYERIIKANFPHLIVGNGGNGLRYFGTLDADSKVRYDAKYGASRVKLNKFRALIEHINVDGEVIDSYTLRK